MRWATSRCWSAAPSSNSSDPTGSDKPPPRPSARTPASAEVRHPAIGNRQPPPAAGPQSLVTGRRHQPPVAKSPPPASFGGNPLQTKPYAHFAARRGIPAAQLQTTKKRSGLSRRELEPFFSTGHHPHRKRGSIGGIRPRNEHRPVGLSSSRTAATCRFPQPT